MVKKVLGWGHWVEEVVLIGNGEMMLIKKLMMILKGEMRLAVKCKRVAMIMELG